MIELFFENLWKWKCGIKEKAVKLNNAPELLVLYKCQWSGLFVNYMRHRLAMGYFRYGDLNKNKKGLYDNIGSIEEKLALYKESGNDEILVDISNLCMVEFVNGNHPKKHFNPLDDVNHTSEADV